MKHFESIFSIAFVSLATLTLIVAAGCTGGTQSPKEDTIDTGTGVETDLDTGPDLTVDTETDRDTGPEPGLSCEVPIVLEPGVKYIEYDGNFAAQKDNRWDLNHQDVCWRWNNGCSCIDDCHAVDDGTAGAQACFDTCFTTDPECAATCSCRRLCAYRLAEDKANCDPDDPVWPCTTNCVDNENQICGGIMGSELFFNVDITTSQHLLIKDEGGINPYIRILSSCDLESATCNSNERLPSGFAPDSQIYDWTPQSDGSYTVMIEDQYSLYGHIEPYYHLEIGIFETTETDCADGKDNDGNDLFDCLDPACYSTCGIIPTLNERFDSALPVGWTPIPATGEGVWRQETGDVTTEGTSGGSYATVAGYIYAVEIIGDEILETSEIVRADTSKVVLTYSQELGYYSYPARQEIHLSTDGSTWQTIVRHSPANLENRRNWDRGFEVVNLTDSVGGATSFWLRFVFDDNGVDPTDRLSGINWSIDDVSILEGDFDILGETRAYYKEPASNSDATGCDGSSATCESLSGHDFGSGVDSLGWYFNGTKCVEGIGDLSVKDDYCFFDDPGNCAKTCAEAGECNREAFVSPYWPQKGHYTRCELSLCAASADMPAITALWDGTLDLVYDQYACTGRGYEETDYGVDIWSIAPPRPLNDIEPEDWEYYCAYSLLPYTIELYCACGISGCP